MIRFLQSGNKAAKYILSVFLLIICGGMVVYLIPGFMSGADVNSRSGVIATVAGTNIGVEEVNQFVQSQTQGRPVPDFYMPILMQQAVRQLIQKQEVRYEAQRLGLKVSDQEVRDELEHGQLKTAFFPGGNWVGQQQYENIVADQWGLTVPAFEAQLKDSLLVRKLVNTIMAGVNVSPAEVERAFKEQNTKVKFEYAVLDLEEIKKQVNPTEAELKAFYDQNKARYQNMIGEKRQVHYFLMTDKDAESKVTVDAGALQRYYNENQDAYRVPERARARHILIKMPPPGPDGKVDPKAVEAARAKAADIAKQVKGGADFAALAKKESADPGSADKGGELGWVVKGQTVPEFERVVYAQAPGQISDPVQTQFGFHIIQTEEKESAHLKPFSEVKPEIEQMVKAKEVGDYLDKAVATTGDIARKQGLEKAAAQSGAQIVQSNPVSRTDALPGVGTSPEVMAAVFAAQQDSDAQIARYTQGYMVFKVTKIEPARTPSFEEIKERVTTDFKAQRAGELFQRKLAALADRAHAEHDLAKAAKEAGATVKTSELVGRTSNVEGLGPMSGQAGAIFALKPGEISGPIPLGPKGVVAKMLERQEPSTNDPQFVQQRDTLAEQLSEQKRQQALELFMSELENRLKKDGKVKINQAEMQNLTRSRG
ncbi:MAG TPA: peptidyl-prolyl cis-trans isomerase [Candidatus Angelobacter sp.]|nr:peptidyl-prolyl cis-trans isomerase [Candidatus Angelobacter sp.]